MNTKAIIAFIAGAVGGAAAGAVVTKKYLENNLNEEIEEVRKYYENELAEEKKLHEHSGRYPWPKDENKEEAAATDISEEKSGKEELKEEVEKLNYSEISTAKKTTKKSTSKKGKKKAMDIHVIEPEDFSSDREYDKVTLTYCEGSGDFLTIDNDRYEGAMDVIGEENLDSFGEFEDNVLYVRNDSNKTDYEVIRDDRTMDDYLAEEYGN